MANRKKVDPLTVSLAVLPYFLGRNKNDPEAASDAAIIAGEKFAERWESRHRTETEPEPEPET